jgi:hypothetical protein
MSQIRVTDVSVRAEIEFKGPDRVSYYFAKGHGDSYSEALQDAKVKLEAEMFADGISRVGSH